MVFLIFGLQRRPPMAVAFKYILSVRFEETVSRKKNCSTIIIAHENFEPCASSCGHWSRRLTSAWLTPPIYRNSASASSRPTRGSTVIPAFRRDSKGWCSFGNDRTHKPRTSTQRNICWPFGSHLQLGKPSKLPVGRGRSSRPLPSRPSLHQNPTSPSLRRSRRHSLFPAQVNYRLDTG